jgi:hypothetical protein
MIDNVPADVRPGYSLSGFVERSVMLPQLLKSDLRVGDHVFVKTHNSLYVIRVAGNGSYLVSGGWFDRKGLSPMKTTIAGCTWGGSIIKVDVVAACGLCLEFGNRLTTSAIRKVFVFRRGVEN